jgi:hypothetical protein
MKALTSVAANGGCGCDGACNGTCGSTCQTETMIRPLFFAGQLLTEDDLQQLEDYVVAKNRLHNRYLFGAGVVCGFEVVCDPCSTGRIYVRPGYALDCCGNDLILTCRTGLDMNAMIRDLLRDERGGVDCGDPCAQDPPAPGTGKAAVPIREYCLTLQYCQQETDPVSPYATDAPCSPQACEPSRIREGLRFALRCPEAAGPPGDFFTAIAHCVSDVIKLEKIGTDADALRHETFEQQIEAGLSALRQRSFGELQRLLLDLIDRSPHPTACTLRERVLSVSPPPPGRHDAETAGTGVDTLIEIFLKLLRECLCMAVLLPCAPCESLQVELARIRVRGCDVVEICNLSRQFVLSPAVLRYWLGFGRLERELWRFCCLGDECRPPAVADGPAERETAEPGPSPRLPAESVERAGRVVEDFLRALALLVPPGSPEGPHLSRLASLIGRLVGREPEQPTSDVQAELAALRERVDQLERQLQQQGGRQRPPRPS